jgi:hypothetical protein
MKEALKLALEAMQRIDGFLIRRGYSGLTPQEEEVIAAIEAALAQGEQSMVSYERFMSVEKELADMTAEFMSVAKQLTQPAQQEPVAIPKIEWVGTDSSWVVQYLLVNSIFDAKQIGEMLDFAASAANKFYTAPPQLEERNFCSRCGKRTADLTVIHTCTPPQKNT